MKAFAFVLSSLAACTFSGFAENWPQWRGPSGNGIAPEGEYPEQLSPDKTLAWKVKLPSNGSSTPIVWGDKIILTSTIDKLDGVLCYDWEGKEVWRTTLDSATEAKHRNASSSNPSPVTDGERVFVYFKSGTVAAFDLEGKELWRKNLQEMYGSDTLWWDLGTSPVLAAGNVVVAVMQEGDSYLVALNQESGEIAWKTDRNYKVNRENDQSYTTPIVRKEGEKEFIVTWGSDHLTGHDASDGSLLWTSGGFNPKDEPMWRTIASPVASDGVALVPYGRGEFVAAMKLDGEGDVTKSHRLWERTGFGSDVPTPIAHDGKFILLTDKGQIIAMDIQTGKTVWEASLPKERYSYYASPILAGDLLYLVREDGAVFCGKIKEDGFELISENNLEEQLIATPVVLNDRVLIRGAEHLYCFKAKE